MLTAAHHILTRPSRTTTGNFFIDDEVLGRADARVLGGRSEQVVDVAVVLNGLSAKNPENLDWKRSIVDLMKLVGMDSSLSARKQLATELHYTGDQNDSASMNIWLHKEVLRKLAENGGTAGLILRSIRRNGLDCSRYIAGTRGKGEVNAGTNHLGFRCVRSASQDPQPIAIKSKN